MKIVDFGLYTVDKNYVRKLHETDSEVYFDEVNYERKPYAGILLSINSYKYFIPLTSAKNKHTSWDLVSKNSLTIYEEIPRASIRPNWICIDKGGSNVKHILSVLDIKKMIPVPDKSYSKIDFSSITDIKYKILLQKEYNFIKSHIKIIIQNAEKIYTNQKSTKKINLYFCNYESLESICDTYR